MSRGSIILWSVKLIIERLFQFSRLQYQVRRIAVQCRTEKQRKLCVNQIIPRTIWMHTALGKTHCTGEDTDTLYTRHIALGRTVHTAWFCCNFMHCTKLLCLYRSCQKGYFALAIAFSLLHCVLLYFALCASALQYILESILFFNFHWPNLFYKYHSCHTLVELKYWTGPISQIFHPSFQYDNQQSCWSK